MSARENEALVRRLYDRGFPPSGVNDNELISPDYEPTLMSVRRRNIEMDAPMPTGIPAWDLERDLYRAELYDLRFELINMVAEGDVVVAVLDVHGTPDHPLDSERRLIAFHRFSGGLLTMIEHQWVAPDLPFDTLVARLIASSSS